MDELVFTPKVVDEKKELEELRKKKQAIKPKCPRQEQYSCEICPLKDTCKLIKRGKVFWSYGSVECYDLNGECAKCSNKITCLSMKTPAMKKSVQMLLKTIGKPTEVTRRILGIGELEDVG